jgi:hypothetical protein
MHLMIQDMSRLDSWALGNLGSSASLALGTVSAHKTSPEQHFLQAVVRHHQ